MDNTAIQSGSPPGANGRSTAIQAKAPVAAAPVAVAPRPQRKPKSLAWQVLEHVASLKITVTLFALSLFLVFWGTLAQVDKGVWTVVAEYFRSPLVWVPLKLITLWRIDGDISIPYPGGWLLGGLLFVNLVAAHIVSFKLTWRRSGIVVLHAGIVVMMIGELITGLCAVESQMHINEHGTSNYTFQLQAPELAVVNASDLKRDAVTVIPTALLRRGGVVSDPALPFDVDIQKYMVNSMIDDLRPGDQSPATHGQGRHFRIEERSEGVGVSREQKADYPSAIVALKDRKTGAALGTYVVSAFLDKPDWVDVDGKKYQLSLRFKHVYKDYTYRLDKLTIKYYPGTKKPQDYSSYIHLTYKHPTDVSRNEERDVRIWMNNPFVFHDETFYQSGVDESRGQRSTTLQVVHNPGWMLPYLSCFMVASGMLFHFGLNLYRFVGRRVV